MNRAEKKEGGGMAGGPRERDVETMKIQNVEWQRILEELFEVCVCFLLFNYSKKP